MCIHIRKKLNVLHTSYSYFFQRLEKHCEETLMGLTKEDEKEKFKSDQNKSQNENVKTVMDVLKNCLELVQGLW
jgi:hypothetical protein